MQQENQPIILHRWRVAADQRRSLAELVKKVGKISNRKAKRSVRAQ
jgi:hypothetical protein